jgi:citrate synthase
MTPKKSLTFAANTLYQLRGEPADEESIRALEVALILRADNELNPSTFAARVTASTGADMYSCILAALSALSGPRHGWHTRQVLKALEEIGTPEQVPAWVRSRLEMRAKIPGFGHQVYQGEDPRTGTLRSLAERHCERAGILPLYRTARALEEAVVREAGQYPIVDFYLTPLYRALGLPADLFTAIFAVSRMCGWVAHALEQSRDENLIRPRAEYTGPEGLLYIPVRRRK